MTGSSCVRSYLSTNTFSELSEKINPLMKSKTLSPIWHTGCLNHSINNTFQEMLLIKLEANLKPCVSIGNCIMVLQPLPY